MGCYLVCSGVRHLHYYTTPTALAVHLNVGTQSTCAVPLLLSPLLHIYKSLGSTWHQQQQVKYFQCWYK